MLADSSTSTALIAGAALVLGAVLTAVAQALTANRTDARALKMAKVQNEHALAMLRSQNELEAGDRHRTRVEERRADVYSALLTSLHIGLTNIANTLPMVQVGDTAEPIAAPPEDELYVTSGKIAAFGSEAVSDLVTKWNGVAGEFYVWAGTIQQAQHQGDIVDSDWWLKLNSARDSARRVVESIERTIRAELQGLEAMGERDHTQSDA
jgi:hypothetical protein